MFSVWGARMRSKHKFPPNVVFLSEDRFTSKMCSLSKYQHICLEQSFVSLMFSYMIQTYEKCLKHLFGF